MDNFGILFGSTISLAAAGAVLGLIPLITGHVKQCKEDGLIGFKACMFGNVIIGFFLDLVFEVEHYGAWSTVLVLALAIICSQYIAKTVA